MDIAAITSKAGSHKTKAALDAFLSAYLHPAFGSLPKSEVELLVLRLLAQVGAISERPEQYELVSKLKITRAKARKLIYDQELRTRTPSELDEDVRQLLTSALLQKRGDSFAMEIENPLLSDHIRAKLKSLGHVTDGSFSPNLVTLKIDGMVELVEASLTSQQKKQALEGLHQAGAPEKTLKGVLKSVLIKLGTKVADETGEVIAKDVSEHIKTILFMGKDAIASTFESLFSAQGK